MKHKLTKLLGISIIGGIIGLSYINYTNTEDVYVVKKGDTFSGIHQTLSSNIPFSRFKEFNRHLFEENGSYDRLDVGDRIYIEKDESSNSDSSISNLENVVDDNIYNFISQIHDNPSTAGINHPSLTVIASSNIAEGLANYYLNHKEIQETISQALDNIIQTNISSSFNPYTTNLLNVNNFGNHGLYLSHLNIILGEYERVVQDGKYEKLNQRISRHLAEKSLSDHRKHMSSYQDNSLRWPADQAALLFSLSLYDRNFGTNISEEPIKKWLEYMRENGTDENSGLHHSEVTGRTKYSSTPRGCALSWTVRYMSKFAPNEAKKLWDTYKAEFLVDYVAFAGFREYPKGSKLKPDIDSGPIFNGIGASATAFGLGAANAMGDKTTYFKINNAYALGQIGLSIFADSQLQRLSSDLLSSSIIFSGRNQ